ncbi:MAG TPA: HEAT repeat domain-containing protein [Anaeromyxobacteraceae bacterium]|nr:HEAT repeat domain-containing protein [Anaeromyxobacteraceae bacterium]
MTAPDSLARLLVEEGLVSEGALERARARQDEAGGALDTALLELGLVEERILAEALASAAGLPAAPASALLDPDLRARRAFPSKVAERHGMVPFGLEGRELLLAAVHPVDQAILDEVSFMLSLHLRTHVAPEWRVRALIERLYGTPMPERLRTLAARFSAGAQEVQRAAASPAVERADGDLDFGPVAEAALPGRRGFGGRGGRAEPLAAALAQAVEVSEARAILDEPPSPAAPERRSAPGWKLADARKALAEARDRDGIVSAALRYARDFFESAALFAVTRDAVWGHDALGPDDAARERCRALAVSVDEAGLFRPALETRGPYLGPAAKDEVTRSVLAGLERGTPRTVLVYPVTLRQRVVCLLLADNGEAPVSPRRLGDLLVLLSTVGGAFERVLRERKLTAGGAAETFAPAPPPSAPPPAQAPLSGDPASPVPLEPWQVAEPARAEMPMPEEVEVDLGEYEVGPPPSALLGEAPAPGEFSPAAAPSPLEALVQRLAQSARGSAERASLIGELARAGEEAAAALAARLPGPIESRSEALAEATPVSEQGPLLAALAALGPAATRHLLPVLSDPDRIRRRYAVLLLGQLGDAAALPALAEAAFDADARVASAARAALSAHRREPEIEPLRVRLRRALSEPVRASAAARALARLGDVESVPVLVHLLQGDEPAATAAAEALSRLTMQRLGAEPGPWMEWWQRHRGEPRRRWLLAGLTSEDHAVRRLAAEELRAAGAPPLAYFPDAPPAERERAAHAWAAWLESQGVEL